MEDIKWKLNKMRFKNYLSEGKMLVIYSENDLKNPVGKRKLKFTKKNIEKIAYEWDAKIEKIEQDIKNAVLRDKVGRLLFVEEK